MVSNPYVKAVAGNSSSKRQERQQKSKAAAAASTAPSAGGQAKAKAAVTATAGSEQNRVGADDVLRAEILALGGDEEDLKMLQDVESESEFEEDGTDEAQAGHDGRKKGDKVDVSVHVSCESG